jgi:hypothetical protein
MKQKLKERALERPVEPEGCHHYWIIEVANGPSSVGRCKICGKKKEFLNAFPDFNPMKRRSNPLDLPKMGNVGIDKDSKS